MTVWRLIAALCLLVLTGCATPPQVQEGDVQRLARAITDLGPQVQEGEAHRAARIAYQHSTELARLYQITDPPLVHNSKVNMGLKPRGLCWHWAEDMEKRLRVERFDTLEIHRAIANADNPLRLDHSTALIAARGAGMDQGIVLDPWRRGGRLYWSSVAQDTAYDWRPRHHVLMRRGTVRRSGPAPE